jgi:hypothetical protein
LSIVNRVGGLAGTRAHEHDRTRRCHCAVQLARHGHANERLPEGNEMDVRNRKGVAEQLAWEVIPILEVR